MSKIEVNTVEPQCGTNLTVGASGDTITFPSGTTVVNNGSQTGFGRTGTVDWDTTPKTATFSAVSGNGYFCNTTSSAFTVNLPAGSAGAIVSLADYAGTWDSNNLTVSPNGTDKMGGFSEDVTLNTEGQSVTFVFVDSTQGWINTMDSTSNVRGEAFIVATGGTVTCCGDYKIHTFTGPGTFTVCSVGNPAGSDTVDYLVVAGGGGGAVDIGGGGGGGGTRFSAGTFSVPSPLAPIAAPAGITVTATAFPITVGAGGTASSSPPAPVGGSGGVSTFSTITSAGGGGGGKLLTAGVNGGNGGGAGGPNSAAGPIAGGSGNTPPVSPAQGKNGGTALGGTPYSPGPVYDGAGAGGGGVQSVGANSGPTFSPSPAFVADGGGAGGTGMPFPANSFQSSATGYGGGGGGGGYTAPGCNVRPAGTATDGGGAGGYTGGQAGTAGTTNRGGGGGGGAGAGGAGAAGGSGIVVIRYKFQ